MDIDEKIAINERLAETEIGRIMLHNEMLAALTEQMLEEEKLVKQNIF